MDDERRAELEARLVYLDGAAARHRRYQQRAPWLLLTTLLGIPAMLIWGAAAGFYTLGLGVTLMSLVFYVSWNHENECATEQDAIRVMLAGGAGAVAAADDAQAGHSLTGGTADDARTGAERDKQRAQHDRYRRPRHISL